MGIVAVGPAVASATRFYRGENKIEEILVKLFRRSMSFGACRGRLGCRNFTVAFGAASADRQERDGTAAAVAALIVVFALGLEEHQRRLVVVVVVVVMVSVVMVMVLVVVVVLIAVVVVIVGLVVIVLAEEIAVVSQRKFVAGHQLALAQGAPETLDVVDLAFGSHHKIRPAETQTALVALGTK